MEETDNDTQVYLSLLALLVVLGGRTECRCEPLTLLSSFAGLNILWIVKSAVAGHGLNVMSKVRFR